MRAFFNVSLILVVGGVALGFHKEDRRTDSMAAPQDAAGVLLAPPGPRQRADAGLGHGAGEPTSALAGGATAVGWVKKIDLADSRFHMTTVDNEQLAIHVAPPTMLRMNGRDLTLDELRGEDQVRVDYAFMNGRIVALAIVVDRR